MHPPADEVNERWLSGRTILITGAQGFIGSWLVQRALRAGASIIALHRAAAAESRFRTDGMEQECEFLDVALTDADGLRRALRERGVSTVFHLAAQPLVNVAVKSPLATFEANIRGTYTLLEACRQVDSERGELEAVVVASSANVYGPGHEGAVDERASIDPSNPHDVSKAASDLIARSYASTYGLPVAVTRLTNVFGGGDLNWSRIVPATARALAHGGRPIVRSDGRPEHDFIYAADAIEAYLTVARSLESPELRGRTWNAGAGWPRSVLEVVRGLIDASGSDIEPDVRGERAAPGTPSPGPTRIDSTAIHRELGWRPQWEFESALVATYHWYEHHLNRRSGVSRR